MYPTGSQRMHFHRIISETSMKICWENKNYLKLDKVLRKLHEDLSAFYWCRRHQIAIKTLCSSEMVSGCYRRVAAVLRMCTCHKVMLHVRSLACSEMFWHSVYLVQLSDRYEPVVPDHSTTSRSGVSIAVNMIKLSEMKHVRGETEVRGWTN